jgi:hypothetical protein
VALNGIKALMPLEKEDFDPLKNRLDLCKNNIRKLCLVSMKVNRWASPKKSPKLLKNLLMEEIDFHH